MTHTPFDILPNELICTIGHGIPDAKSLNSILKCSRHLAAVLTPFLHKMAVEDHDGLPAIHWAAREGYEALVEFLTNEKGVPVDLEHITEGDTIHRTPLDFAVKARKASMVRFLLKKGAAVNIPNSDSNRSAPIYIAALMGLGMKESRCKAPFYDIIDDALAAEALVIAKILLDHGANPNCTLSSGTDETALHYAASYGHIAMVKLLLENRAEVDLKDRFGKTALHNVVTGLGDGGFAAQMRTIDMIELLGWWGADVFAEDSGTKSVMTYALEKGMHCALESLRGYWINCYRSSVLCSRDDL